MDGKNALAMLASDAATIASGYPEAAQRLRDARDTLADAKNAGDDPATVETLRGHYRGAQKAADEYWQLVRRAEAAAVSMLPDVAAELRHVTTAAERWDARPDFPWPDALAELRRIEVAARQPAATADERQNGDAPPVDAEAAMQRMALAGSAEVARLARREGRSASDRMQDIAAVDARSRGFDSTQWGKLLDVTPSAIRQTAAWIQWEADKAND